MRAPLSWIRDFTPVDAPVAEIVAALEPARPRGRGASSEPGRGDRRRASPRRCSTSRAHPDADKLSLVDVDYGDGPDPGRVRRAATSSPGWSCRTRRRARRCPGGFTLERRKIRGVVSDGMLCSAEGARPRRRPLAGSSASTPPTELGADVRERARPRRRGLRPRDHARTGPTRCASSASPASSPRTSRSRSTVPGARRRRPTRRSPSTITVVGRGRRPLPALPRPGRRTVTMGPSPRVDGAAAGEGGDAPDQQRRRRHQLRAARTQPAAARVRPRPARRAAASSCGSPSDGERITTLDGVERDARPDDDLLICDAERAPQAIAGIMGGRDVRGVATTPPRSCSSRRTSSAWASPAARSGSSCAPSRARGSSAASTRRPSPRNAERAMELLVEVAGARGRARRRRRVPGSRSTRPRITAAHGEGQRACSAPTLDDDDVADALAPLGIERRRRRDGDELVGDRADVPPRPRTRDRPRRGGGAPRRLRRHRAHRARHPTGQVGGLTRAPAGAPAGRRRAGRARAAPRR